MSVSNDIINFLMIEDNPGDALLIREMLLESFDSPEIYHINCLKKIEDDPDNFQAIDIILLDLNLPDSHGLETVLKANRLLPDKPIIVMTGLDNEEVSLSAIQAGAQDYLVKNEVTAKDLKRTLLYALRRYKTIQDINESILKQKAHLTTHDMLTSMPNQHLFLEKMQNIINNHEIIKKLVFLIIIRINETDKIIKNIGHLAKDKVIKSIAENLVSGLPQDSFVARYSDSIFTILLTKQQHYSAIIKHVENIKSVLGQSIALVDQPYFPSFNMGIAAYPFDGQEPDELIKNAFTALNVAVQKGIKNYETFSKKLDYADKINDEHLWYSDLQFALDRKEFYLVYQPQFNLIEQRIIGVEALLRWKHPTQGLIPPHVFIPLAEESHFIGAIGAWVLEAAVEQFQIWQKYFKCSLQTAVNISIQQVEYSDLLTQVQQLLNTYKMPKNKLTLEVTESIFIDRPEIVIAKLHALKQLGIQIAIDDFGRGYSSLAYLSHLPIDKLKLDLDFVQRMQEDPSTRIIVKSTIELAHSLNLGVTAEGVETAEQLAWLKQFQCDEVQGYYFSKPVSADEITALLTK